MQQMEGVSIKELWMLLGEKDVQIYQLLKQIEKLEGLVVQPSPPEPEKKQPEDPFKVK